MVQGPSRWFRILDWDHNEEAPYYPYPYPTPTPTPTLPLPLPYPYPYPHPAPSYPQWNSSRPTEQTTTSYVQNGLYTAPMVTLPGS